MGAYKIVNTETFLKCLRKLNTSGKKGKDALTKSRAALYQLATEGATDLQPTNHGETRLQNVQKYDLGSGYRLVLQVFEKEKIVASLYAGTHENTERWLNNHKNFQWVKRKKDNTLEITLVTTQEVRKTENIFVEPNIDVPESTTELPILRGEAFKSELEKINAPQKILDYVFQIKRSDWERDPNGIIAYIEEKAGIKLALLFTDLLTLAYNNEDKKILMRLKLELNEAFVPNEKELSKALTDPINSETIVTWEEVNSLPENSSWADWLLFLHPEQKKIAKKDFNGPCRLRGVSGSGKTSVMLHRARYLALKYQKPILLLTLTESMRKLLDVLIKDLCGVESTFIHTLTVNRLAEKIIGDLHPRGPKAYTKPSPKAVELNNQEILRFIKSHSKFRESIFKNMNDRKIIEFINEEYDYVLGRLPLSLIDIYLDTKDFVRRGRGIRLNKTSRLVCFDTIKKKISLLVELHQLDYSCITQAANALLNRDDETLKMLGWGDINISELKYKIKSYKPFRCVLVDEVQDLSQQEIEMIAELPTQKGRKIKDIEDGLFLVGDGAQTVYNKGFRLKECGVKIANRSFALKKNYRNSFEIMKAAYSLIKEYEFADVDEDNITKPILPDYPNRIGEKPFIIKCKTLADEIDFVVSQTLKEINDFQEENETSDYPEICIIGLTKNVRNQVKETLTKTGLAVSELKSTVGVDNNTVSISTIESAKGHEFQIVFIVNVVASILPRADFEDNLAREAARLYVAMTRAREKLYITYSDIPSKFLINIQNDCNELVYEKGKLKLLN